MKVLLINGSPARHSHTNALLGHLQDLFVKAGQAAEVLDLRALDLPPNDPAFHWRPEQHPAPKVRQFVSQVAAADIVMLGSPLYHGSFSGLLKSALDHLAGDAFAGKAVGIASNASGIRGSFQAAQQLVVVARTMSGRVSNRLLGTGMADYVRQADDFVLASEEIANRAQLVVQNLIHLGEALL